MMPIHPTLRGACALLLLTAALDAQAQSWGASSTQERETVHADRNAMMALSWTSGLDLHNIGPGVMGGRVVDLAVVGDTIYVAYATGGLWKTVNQGATFEPLLEATTMLGAVDAHPSGRILVGSGEVNSSRSSYAGDGVYLSNDGGLTWAHAGLAETHHVGRVCIDPNRPDRMWVAALGELYSKNQGGGVYRTEDAGDTWTRVLTVKGDGKSVVGAVDLVVDPGNPNHLYAATWDRTRRAHEFTEAGGGSGIWESQDGGNTWIRISKLDGFPEGPEAGRIGLAHHAGSNTLYALIDNQAARPKDEDAAEEEGLTPASFLDMSAEAFLALDNDTLQAYLDENGFQPADSAASVKTGVQRAKLTPRALYDYLSDGNAALFDTEIVGPELYALQDGTWRRTHEGWLDDVWYTYGYYFGTVSVDPSDENTVYIAGVPLLKSTDGGQTFEHIGAPNVHVDHHKVWIDPNNPRHVLNGNDGGMNVSWDGGESWIKCNSPSVGQFYAVEVDDAEPYNVYGGLQDNGTWKGPHTHKENPAWHQTGQHPYRGLGGGDGMQIEVDIRNADIVFTGYQFGWYRRTNLATGESTSLHPTHDLGETPLRWNWQTPIQLSTHQQDILYMGSNKLHRSMDQGETWETLSGDLTRGGLAGNVPFGTLTTLAEHPERFGQLAVGSDDGLVHVSTDGGHAWKRLDMPIPTSLGKGDGLKHAWVTEVMWSHHDADLLVVALNGYRHDALDAWVFATRNGGKTWERWGKDLPSEPVNALVELKDHPGWWVVGTDGGAYLTTNAGASFSALHRDLPRVPVHDLVVQERENDLIVGTHGRGIYRMDLSSLDNLTSTTLDTRPLEFVNAKVEVARREDWNTRGWAWSEPEEPVAMCWVWSPVDGTAQVHLRTMPASKEDQEGEGGLSADQILDQLKTQEGQVYDRGEVSLVRGMQQVSISLLDGENHIPAGAYQVTLKVDDLEARIRLECDTELVVTEEEIKP
jgi:photosystem II stability/assembly factor-like uncharacterized protein